MMKKIMKKAVSVLMAALILTGVYSQVASAETKKVIIHVQDGLSWGSMNVYNWGDNGETAGVWPGTPMTQEADGWFTYTFETEVPLNLVFSAEGGSPQSGNVENISADVGEIWIVIGGGEGANMLGVATNEAVLYLEPQEGWPVAKEAVDTEAAIETAAKEEAIANVPKTGVTTGLATTFAVLAASCALGMVVSKKKVNKIN